MSMFVIDSQMAGQVETKHGTWILDPGIVLDKLRSKHYSRENGWKDRANGVRMNIVELQM